MRISKTPEYIPPHKDQMDRLRRMAKALLERADEIEAIAAVPEDDFVEGAVLVFTKPGRYIRRGWGEEFGDEDDDFVGLLKYAAIKAGGEWFLTGKHTAGKSWHDLLDFIGRENWPTIKTVSQTVMFRPAWAKPS